MGRQESFISLLRCFIGIFVLQGEKHRHELNDPLVIPLKDIWVFVHKLADEFERWVIAPNAKIVTALAERHPQTPIIGFPKGAGEKLPAYARETGVKAVGVDETLDPVWVARELPAGMAVQGNLDPLLLLSGSPALETRIETILEAFSDRPHVFNLGHGIDRRTPIANVERLIATVRGWQG